jgi:GAF domain-containing protein
VASLGARRGPDDEAWSEDDLNLIEAIAGQAALAVENARQSSEEHRRLGELEVLNRVSQAVSQMLRLDSLLKVVHAQINQLLGSVNLTYAFYDSATGQLSRPYISQTGEVKSLPARPLGDDLVSHVVRSQTPLLLGSDLPARAAEIGVRLDATAPRSWLGVPMLVGEDVVGVIAVEDLQRPERFTDEDSALLSTIASQVAAAFQNARLLEQVQRSARRERLIHEIATKVRRSPDFRSILETTTRELGRALNAARASVQLGRGNGGPSDGAANPEADS